MGSPKKNLKKFKLWTLSKPRGVGGPTQIQNFHGTVRGCFPPFKFGHFSRKGGGRSKPFEEFYFSLSWDISKECV